MSQTDDVNHLDSSQPTAESSKDESIKISELTATVSGKSMNGNPTSSCQTEYSLQLKGPVDGRSSLNSPEIMSSRSSSISQSNGESSSPEMTSSPSSSCSYDVPNDWSRQINLLFDSGIKSANDSHNSLYHINMIAINNDKNDHPERSENSCNIFQPCEQPNSTEMFQKAVGPITRFKKKQIKCPFRYCTYHENATIVFCNSCVKVVCSICETNLHNDHFTKKLFDPSNPAYTKSNEALNHFKSSISIIETNVLKIQNYIKVLDYHAENVCKSDVVVAVKGAISALQKRKSDLHALIEDMNNEKNKLIQGQNYNLQSNMDYSMAETRPLPGCSNSSNANSNPSSSIPVSENVAQASNNNFDGFYYPQLKNWLPNALQKKETVRVGDNSGTDKWHPDTSVSYNGRALRGRGSLSLLLGPPQQQQQIPNFYGYRTNHGNVPSSGRPIPDTYFPVVVKTGMHGVLPRPRFIIGENNELCRPWGVVCDSAGDIFIADRSNNQIQVYTQMGEFVTKFGSLGSGPGQFNKPAGITIDARQRVIVSDKDNHRIQILTKYGQPLLIFGEKGSKNGQFNYPWDVAVNKNCEIVVSDTRNHRIQLFTPEGIFLRKYGFETTPNMWKILDLPRSVCFNPQGHIITADFNNHHILVIDYFCTKSKVISCNTEDTMNPFFRMQGLIVDDEGNIIVADSRNNRIQVLDSKGSFKWMFGSWGEDEFSQMTRPCGIALTPEGRVVVVDFDKNRVLVY